MRKVSVRNKKNILIWQIPDDLNRVCRGHANIGPRLNLRCRIDIADYCQILILRARLLYGFFYHHMRHRTVCLCIGHQHRFRRIEQLGALPHKGYTAENNRALRQPDSLFAQKIRIPYVICNLLYLRTDIVMCQYHCVLFVLQLLYLFLFCHAKPPCSSFAFCSIAHIFTADKTPVMTNRRYFIFC